MVHSAIFLIACFAFFSQIGKIYCQINEYVVVKFGGNATIACFYGKDKSTIHWYKDSEKIATITDGIWSKDLGPNYAPGPDSSLVIVNVLDDHINLSCRSKNHTEFFILVFNVTANILSDNLSGKERNMIFQIIPKQFKDRLVNVAIKPIDDDQACNKDYMGKGYIQRTSYEQLEGICDSTFSLKYNMTESDKAHPQCVQFWFALPLGEQYSKSRQIKKNETGQIPNCEKKTTAEPTRRGKENSGYRFSLNPTGLLILVLYYMNSYTIN